MRVKLLAVLLLLISGIAEAQLSKAAQEWRRGPEKFLMTDDEEKAWKAVTSDAAAAAFIDLFWARRDPTPGTQRNEFREEFLARVRYSDESFAETRRRGALSERGQVYIVLGPPEGGSRERMVMAGHSGMSSASARTAEGIVWTWPRETALALGVPKITVGFNQIVGTDVFNRDTRYGQFSNVARAAIQKNIVDPTMTAVPEWAERVSREVLAGAPKAEFKAAGRIGRLVLLDDLGALDLDAVADPIAALRPAAAFAAEGELAYVLEYCGTIAGALKVESSINEITSSTQIEPTAMKALPGCGAVVDMLALSGLPPGSYELRITTIEPNGGRLTTSQRVRIR